jgi:hypothetical protein
MQDAFGNIILFHIRLAETEDIGVRNRPCPQAGTHGVSDNTTYAGSCAAIRVKG